MRTLQLILLLLFLQVFAYSQLNEHYIQLQVENKKELTSLTRMVSIDDRKGNNVLAYATDQQLLRIDKAGYEYQELTHPGKRLKSIKMAETLEEMENWDRYPTYKLYVKMMHQYAEDYPDLCRIDTIGYSIGNRMLLALRISDNPGKQENEPEVFYTSTMHGDETTGYVLMLRLIDFLLNNYGTNSRVTKLLDGLEVHINPNANPDGTYASGNNTLTGATRNNAAGIDINRNFPDPDNGPHPDGNTWQPETRAMIAYARRHAFNLSANFHGGAEVANYPWDTWERDHVDADWWKMLAHTYADPAMADGPEGYFTSVTANGITNGYDWYPVYGSRQDFMTYMQNGREITMEISDTKLPDAEKIPDFWSYNKRAMLNYLEQALYGIHGVVKNTAGNPLHAEVRVLNHDKDKDSSMVFTDPDVGDYHRFIAPGTYTLVAMAKGYLPDTLTGITAEEGTFVRADFQLEAAQKITFTGRVKQLEDDTPLEGAVVRLLETGREPRTTDAGGAFVFEDVPEGNYTVQAEKYGYGLQRREVALRENSTKAQLALWQEIVEDFETGSFNRFSWKQHGSASWKITTNQAVEGSYAASSGSVADGETAALELQVDVEYPGMLTFFAKISTEAEYDFLHFYVDDEPLGSWSGEKDWQQRIFALDTGKHTLRWEFARDAYAGSGQNKVWIDQISFPKIALPEPALYVSTDSISLQAEPDSLITRSLQLKNTSEEELRYKVTEKQAYNWLLTEPVQDTLAPGEIQELKIYIQAPAQETDLKGALEIAHNLQQHTYSIPVDVQVRYKPRLAWEPSAIKAFGYYEEQKTDVRELKLWNSGSGSVSYSLQLENFQENPWLSVEGEASPLQADTAVFQIKMDPSVIDTGRYSSALLLHDSANARTYRIPVQYELRYAPDLAVIPETLADTLEAGEESGITLRVENTGSSAGTFHIRYADKADTSWLKTDTTSFKLNAGATRNFEVHLQAGVNDSLRISYLRVQETATGNERFVPVRLLTRAYPAIAYKPDAFRFKVDLPEATATKYLKVQNAGSGVLEYAFDMEELAAPWLRIPQGNITAGTSWDSVAVKVQASDLPAGTYTTQINMQANDTTTQIPVALVVYSKARIVLGKDRVALSLQQGQQAEVPVIIQSSGRYTLGYSVTNTDLPDWLDANAMKGTVKPDTQDTLLVSLNASGLAPGTYESSLALKDDREQTYLLGISLEVLPLTGISRTLEQQFKVYPNPFASVLHLHIPDGPSNAGRLIIRSLHGTRVKSLKVKPGSDLSINFPGDMPEGLYLVQFITKEGAVIRKRILQR